MSGPEPMEDLFTEGLAESIVVDGSDDDEIEIELIDDRPAEDQVEARDESASPVVGSDEELDAEIEKAGGRAGKRIAKIKYEFHEERRAKEAAERVQEEAITFAKAQQRENAELRAVLSQGETVLVDEMKLRGKSSLEKARSDYKNAYEEGDLDKQLQAQEDLFRAQNLTEVAESPGSIIPEHLQGPAQPETQQRQAPAPDPAFDKWKSRNSEWFGRNKAMTSLAFGTHDELMDEGLDPRRDSETYYKKLDSVMRKRFPESFSGESDGAGDGQPAATPRTKTVVAPARRSSGAKSGKIALSPSSVVVAKRLGLTNQQYAKAVLELEKHGNE